LKNGEDIRDAVPTGVFEYIEEYDVFGQRFKLAKIKVKKVQSESRFSHTLGVIDTATSLAIQYGVDVEKAKWAALLHDCAKPFSTNLLHAKEGAILAKKEYSVDDPMILDAIAYHTTGRPKMTLLEKIIYVADYIEPNRNKAPNLEILRQVAFEDLNRCVCMIAEASLHYLKSSGESNIDPLTEQTYTYYKERM
jgi:putative nucleotidyltransferase with HDIG domain